jgi:anti-sigma B factor antagonist
LVKKQGNELVLAGVSDRIRELLRLTSLDTLWALYASRAEALAMLGGSD